MKREVERADSAAAPAVAGRDPAPGGGFDLLSPGSVTALQRAVGNRATAALVRAAHPLTPVISRLGTPLDQPLPPKAVKPAYGDKPGEQRQYSRKQFTALWEAEQGHTMTLAEQTQVRRGCIGITANNLGMVDPPLDEVYSTFAKAQSIAKTRNAGMERYPTKPWVVFAVHFWSNQDPVRANRATPNPAAFLPDATGKIDMTGYSYLSRPGFVNFDYGFWDEASNSIWHANHYEKGPKDPMKVYQSTMAKFAHTFEETPGEWRFGYRDFDREGWGVAQASNYDPSRATKPQLTSPRLVGDSTIERVFRGKATLGPGSPSKTVKKVQQLLVERGYDLGDYGPAKDGVDGKFGDKTSDAVKQFKADENLGNQSSGRVERGVIMRLDELFPP